jgi:uncharacterized protein
VDQLKVTILQGLTSLSDSIGITGPAVHSGLDAYKKGGYATALREWERWARLGDAPSQCNLGAMYADGIGVTKDAIEAVKWYRLAAEQGNERAQNHLDMMSGKGDGIIEDDVHQ